MEESCTYMYIGEWTVDDCQFFLGSFQSSYGEGLMSTGTSWWTWSSYEENFINTCTRVESGRRLDFNDVIVLYDKIPLVFIVFMLLSDNVLLDMGNMCLYMYMGMKDYNWHYI